MQCGKRREPFEVDEPAARSNTPPGWPIEKIEIMPGGKALKHYGPDNYRFAAALTLSVILPWQG
jgi:5-methylcytosine-specific restriction protein A